MVDVTFTSLPDTAAGVMDAGEISEGAIDTFLVDQVDAVAEPAVVVALRAVRETLGMEVAYLSRIVGGDMVLSELEGDGTSFGLKRGLTLPSEQTYCQRMLDGRLPNLISDVRRDDRVAAMPITRAADIGSFATVPLTLADGRVRGTLCAASHGARLLGYRELQLLNAFARLIADQLERDDAALTIRDLAVLVDAADDAIMGVALSGTVRSWNLACERIFGYSADEAIGQSIIALVAPPGAEDGMRRMFKTAAGGEIVHHQSPRRRSDGQLIETAVTVSPARDEHGEVRFVSAVVRDVSVQVREAALLRERTTELQHALQELDTAQIDTVQRLSRAVEFRDEDTGAHIARISTLAAAIARSAGLEPDHCELIERASLLHDLGKVAIPDSVLLKPGPLTPQERSIMETHTEIGHRLLDGSESTVLQLAASIALTHHERFDGHGYPRGLAGNAIPIEGRIVAIADVYDALTSDRVYRPAMSLEQALAMLTGGRGTHFDPVLLDHFLIALKEGEAAAESGAGPWAGSI